METMALAVAEELSKACDVFVLTLKGECSEPPCSKYTVVRNLSGNAVSDLDEIPGFEDKYKPDVWLVMNAGYSIIVDGARAPVVPYFHGNDFLDPFSIFPPFLFRNFQRVFGLRRLTKRYVRSYAIGKLRRCASRFNVIATNSENTKALIVRKFSLDPSSVVVCHPGVDLRFFQKHETGSDDNVSILTVSRLQSSTRRKNVDGVIEAMALLRGAMPIKFHVVGDGDDRIRLEELSESLGLSDVVVFHGRAPDKKLLELYRTADLFVLASKASEIDVEGFGIVYLEANASGTPVLCCALGGATDAVVDGKTGVVIRDASPMSIADGISRFVETRASFSSSDIQNFADGFKWERRGAQFLTLLHTAAFGR